MSRTRFAAKLALAMTLASVCLLTMPEARSQQPTTTAPERTNPTSQPAAGPIKFFGIGDHAKSVAFVIDGSGAMFETFGYVAAEMLPLIDSLRPEQNFAIILFADERPREWTVDGRAGPHRATAPNRKAAAGWFTQQVARSESGLTDPGPAFERLFKSPAGPPEVVYLLTNGRFPPESQKLIRDLNANGKVRVHTIAWLVRDAEKQLQEVARQNGGKYQFVAEKDLGAIPASQAAGSR